MLLRWNPSLGDYPRWFWPCPVLEAVLQLPPIKPAVYSMFTRSHDWKRPIADNLERKLFIIWNEFFLDLILERTPKKQLVLINNILTYLLKGSAHAGTTRCKHKAFAGLRRLRVIDDTVRIISRRRALSLTAVGIFEYFREEVDGAYCRYSLYCWLADNYTIINKQAQSAYAVPSLGLHSMRVCISIKCARWQNWRQNWSQAKYSRLFQALRRNIAAGDFFVLALNFNIHCVISSAALESCCIAVA